MIKLFNIEVTEAERLARETADIEGVDFERVSNNAQGAEYDIGFLEGLQYAERMLKQKTYRQILKAIADEFQNDYLTPATFADHNHLTTEQAERLIKLAQDVRASINPNK